MTEAAVLTLELARQVQAMVRREVALSRGERKPVASRPVKQRSHMWALTPEGGIPARDGTELGQAECGLYTDEPDEFASDTRMLVPVEIGGVQQTAVVYNGSENVINGGSYEQIEMTSSGAWRVPPPSTSTVGFMYETAAQVGDDITSSEVTLELDYAMYDATTAGWTVDTSTDEFVCVIPGKYVFRGWLKYRIQDSESVDLQGYENPPSESAYGFGWGGVTTFQTAASTAYNTVHGQYSLRGNKSPSTAFSASVGHRVKFTCDSSLRSGGTVDPTIFSFQVCCQKYG